MKPSDFLQNERQRYYNLLDDVRHTSDLLKLELEKLQNIKKNLIKGYMLDDESADYGYIEQSENEANTLYKRLIQVILPAIERKINNLSNSISDAIIKEKLESERGEDDA